MEQKKQNRKCTHMNTYWELSTNWLIRMLNKTQYISKSDAVDEKANEIDASRTTENRRK